MELKGSLCLSLHISLQSSREGSDTGERLANGKNGYQGSIQNISVACQRIATSLVLLECKHICRQVLPFGLRLPPHFHSCGRNAHMDKEQTKGNMGSVLHQQFSDD